MLTRTLALLAAVVVVLTGCQGGSGRVVTIDSWGWNSRVSGSAMEDRSSTTMPARPGTTATVDSLSGPVTFTIVAVGERGVDITTDVPLAPSDGNAAQMSRPVDRFTVAADPVRLVTVSLDAGTHFEVISR
ncbi:hypothetical protein G7070_06085 [Propioniciclava coleopterorum]|uniref:Uncharacterized protein n=1 Tax=Propioniciclava coleopterorum TaxID=2714937 RepID=A0A6G7Y5G7_9ACTN|nr:hypothetical protein [Propioniciclava coleopterorum]QIK71916.1 hypothetical protein G7070_06085 [Propioniciclava coleopterorum]